MHNPIIIEINFSLPDDIRESLLLEGPELILIDKKNLTGGDFCLEILVGLISGVTIEILKSFFEKKKKEDTKAKIIINKISIHNHVEFNNIIHKQDKSKFRKST